MARSTRRHRHTSAMWLTVTMLIMGGCTADPPRSPAAPDPNVITAGGLPGLALGATEQSLQAAGAISTAQPGCSAAFVHQDHASPVFDRGRLVLIWAYPPLHTPEGIAVGSSLAQARSAYPQALALTRAPGSFEYPALLVTRPPDRAFLLLHDGATVQKLIVGYESAVQQLFDTGFGAC